MTTVRQPGIYDLSVLGKQCIDMTDAQALAIVVEAFRDAARPEHFTDYTHCDECAEHDATLRGHSPESIGIKELGNPGWDPVCFLTDEGFHYYLPGLARLALATGREYYLYQFLFHLNCSRRLRTLTKRQKAAISSFLRHLRETRRAEIKRNLDLERLDVVVELLAS